MKIVRGQSCFKYPTDVFMKKYFAWSMAGQCFELWRKKIDRQSFRALNGPLNISHFHSQLRVLVLRRDQRPRRLVLCFAILHAASSRHSTIKDPTSEFRRITYSP